MNEIANTPAYSIITQESAPMMFSLLFDLIESRHVRRSTYIPQFVELYRDISRLKMTNDYDPYIDSEGNIVYSVQG